MHRFATILFSGTMVAVVVGSIALAPTSAGAATSAEKVALKQATAVCKAAAKERNISWPASRKFVSSCVEKAVKLSPADLQKLAVRQAVIGCKAEARGKKIKWPTSRDFVKTCLSNALKDYHLDIAQLRKDLDISGLRTYTAMEIGCMQNVFCD
jgi:hypothetical protein